MAQRDYPDREMYEQAQTIYTYIYQNPQYLTNQTRINHAKMLQAIGDKIEATKILVEAATYTDTWILRNGSNKFDLRRLGEIYMMLGESKRADNYFNQSIEIDQKALALSRIPDEKARLLLSISNTMELRGSISDAITNVEQAKKYAQSPALRILIKRRLKELMKLQTSSLRRLKTTGNKQLSQFF